MFCVLSETSVQDISFTVKHLARITSETAGGKKKLVEVFTNVVFCYRLILTEIQPSCKSFCCLSGRFVWAGEAFRTFSLRGFLYESVLQMYMVSRCCRLRHNVKLSQCI